MNKKGFDYVAFRNEIAKELFKLYRFSQENKYTSDKSIVQHSISCAETLATELANKEREFLSKIENNNGGH